MFAEYRRVQGTSFLATLAFDCKLPDNDCLPPGGFIK